MKSLSVYEILERISRLRIATVPLEAGFMLKMAEKLSFQMGQWLRCAKIVAQQ